MSDDLGETALRGLMPGRQVRTYRALVSTEADARAWARAGAPHGAVVVADYQAAPRGRGGRVWEVRPGRDLAFSAVLRPELPLKREGWLYTVAATALAATCGDAAAIAWPDEVRRPGRRPAALGVHVEPRPGGVAWAVLNVLLPEPGPPRGPTLARLLGAIDDRLGRAAAEVLDEHRARCETLGRRVRVRLAPMGPAGREVSGTAAATLEDGALVVATDGGRRLAVPPAALGVLEEGPPLPAPGRGYSEGGS